MEQQEQTHPSVDSMNAALLSLYESRLPVLNERIKDCIRIDEWGSEKVSKFFFMKVDKEYLNAPKKILFVGRETFGWNMFSASDTAEGLMNFYESVSLGGKHYNSPFWWFRRDFSSACGIREEEFMRATLWTNLSKIDVGKQRPTGRQFDTLMQLFIDLLVAEIEIIKPDVVLVLTKEGFYNWHLNHYRWDANAPNVFNAKYVNAVSLDRTSVKGVEIQQLKTADLILPVHTYQICHPNALRRRGNYTERANDLIQVLVEHINTPAST